MHVARNVAFVLGAMGLVVACGSTSETDLTNGGSSGGGADGGGTLPIEGGPSCNPPCAGAQRCSYAGTCIDPGTCAADGDCEAGTVCDLPTSTCIPGGTCGAEEATGVTIPPNVLVVLDRSCSMTNAVGAETKWKIAVDALSALVTANKGLIRFGLELFPDKDGTQCAQGPFAVPVGPGTEVAVTSLLTAALTKGNKFFPDGPCVTNIDTAMQAAAQEPAFADTTRGNFAILITDGKQSGCNDAGGDAGTTQILKDLSTNKKVPTFVIGFGSGVDQAQMNTFADAGGTPRAGATKYYDASDKASLQAALAAIARKTLSCSFTLTKAPPDSSKIYAFFDNKTAIPRDPAKANGWEYDAASNTVTFYGAVCEDLKAAKVTDVDIVFGCAEPTPR